MNESIKTLAPLELAMQELDMQELEPLDAPVDWSEIVSFISGFSVGGAVSYSVIITLAT
ncbi:hypothetical protein JOL79_31690 [Microbispora sp. RL4-1S]|uniref:Uncharacterized protein n=1 Tax=Microbispora oryzae TaxID=2806554 RepID=A0A940WW34_9ACTN|nr:daptide-type RiPP [Microbispora oryzae]MBP2708351.1 hypothetical protein [Microbispora oryzae]